MHRASVSFLVPLLQIDETHMRVGSDESSSVSNWKSVQVLGTNLVRHELNVIVAFVFFNGNLAGMKHMTLVHHKHVMIPHHSHMGMSLHLPDPLCIGQVCDLVVLIKSLKPLSCSVYRQPRWKWICAFLFFVLK